MKTVTIKTLPEPKLLPAPPEKQCLTPDLLFVGVGFILVWVFCVIFNGPPRIFAAALIFGAVSVVSGLFFLENDDRKAGLFRQSIAKLIPESKWSLEMISPDEYRLSLVNGVLHGAYSTTYQIKDATVAISISKEYAEEVLPKFAE